MTATAGHETDLPTGYRESAVRGVLLVVRTEHHDAVCDALRSGSLYDWAATRPDARALQGRRPAWAARLASGVDVVVRRSHHGGALAGLTGDLFLAPSRAPRELRSSLRLRAAGVPTPDVVAYVTYRALGPFCRADVATTLVPGSDLPAAWQQAAAGAARDAIGDAVAALLRALCAAGAHHPDLNAKNVLISTEPGGLLAWVIDVDRTTFGRAGDQTIAERNAARLARSLAKWRGLHGLDFGAAQWRRIADGAGVPQTAWPAPE